MAIPNPVDLATDVFDRAKTGITEAIDDVGFGKALRSSNLLPGAQPQPTTFTEGSWSDEERVDWRVKLSLPKQGAYVIPKTPSAGPPEPHLLRELEKTGGFVFPYTPQVFITHSASYDMLAPTHSNYPFPVYENSAVDQFTITGDFTAENQEEGRYWIAANQYLRSVTKMAYGDSSLKGNPPPVVKLNGYGDFVFKNVPVVVESYQLTLPEDVDYIKVPIGQRGSWVPAQSQIAISLRVAYSRDKVNQFSLDSFVKGTYVTDPNSTGYI
jgi:hypothetical protein